MLGHVTSSANGQPYTIKINNDFLMRLLKRGATYAYHARGVTDLQEGHSDEAEVGSKRGQICL